MMPILALRVCSIVQIAAEDETDHLGNLLLYMLFMGQLKCSLLHLSKVVYILQDINTCFK